ncbi:aliphatic sulfonates family ABC transporter, periplasmic ligand-binding protein [Kribbella flavida DSM 17836]|uniref:Aliphatic sulfonates family ABC transporter, periplasmic ligand-binding protein n=1 Tax=Kribbella flavida (strain DSM 17836 / JCM 10339 / NBRC 14399) TaxID=479435 RepID=D2PXQ6_KRIFD|nr:ABC transporter substrate-binding protein [Kribbella flavida]ADB31698.1 aliphatic sulfonates family ABC transporter, periplasmic ligand-binding protein [Kribbella flavida DSM 17836]
MSISRFRFARPTRLLAASAAVLSLVAVTAGCSRADRDESSVAATDKGPATELRLGYFPNVTHAAALVGLGNGLFGKELGTTKLVPTKFNAGPEAVGALLGGSLDASFIGSGPAINAYAKSNGEAVRLVAGATSGGAQLVVRPTISKPEDLAGKTVVTPQLGNTQDVSLKKWLAEKNLTGKVKVTNLENAATLDAFQKGDVDAAWLPEPWSSRLVLDAGAKVLLDEAELWPDGKFPTTVLIVRTQFLQEHPESVRQLLAGLVAAIDFSNADKAAAKTVVNDQLKELTGKALKPAVIDRAFGKIEITADPVAAQFPQLAKDQVTAAIAKEAPDVSGFADLGPLNDVLSKAGKPAVDAAGLDKK